MRIKAYLMFAVMAGAMFLAAPVMAAPSQTAQSVMVNITPNNTAYIIEGSITWTYDRDTAETYYTNAWDGNPPVVEAGTGAAQTSPGTPAPDANKLMQHAQAERCVFFCSGALGSDTYTQTVNGMRGWKWTYTYNITPIQVSVGEKTCWSSELTGGTVDVNFNGFVSSESYLSQSGGRTKYSFTLLDADASRVQNVTAQLQNKVGENWVNIGSPISYGTLPVTSTVADYTYFGNAGVFGNSAVYAALHANGGGKPGTLVSAILLEDNFGNNNSDLVNGNVHEADYSGGFPGLTDSGDYRIQVSGIIKGNSAIASSSFTVTSELFVIGGCNCSE